MAGELEEVEDAHLRSALCYALQKVKLPRRRTSPPFDMNAEAAERDIAARVIIEHLKLNKWRVVHRPLGKHFNPDPHPGGEPSPRPDLPSSGRAFTLGRLRGHLTELRIACPLCNRQGVYHLEKQIAQHGGECTILDGMMIITRDCKVIADTPEKCAAGLIDMEKCSGGCDERSTCASGRSSSLLPKAGTPRFNFFSIAIHRR